MNQFKILATFAKSYDSHHNDKNIHLIASTVAITSNFFSNMNLNNISEKDNRNKKTLVIDVCECNNEINVDAQDILKKSIVQWESIEVSLEEYGIVYRFENELVSYIKIKFDYFIMLIKSPENCNLLSDMFQIDYKDKKDSNQLYNQFLFIFNNTTWSNIVLKLKLNNINVSGGSSSTRHILSSSDVLLDYYLNLIFNYDIENILKIIYNSYKNCKDILSNSISLSLYKKYRDDYYDIMLTDPYLLNEKLLSLINKSENSDSELSEVIIMLKNILISRQTIIRVIGLYWKKVLITNIEDKIKNENDLLYEYKNQYTNPIIVFNRKMKKKNKKLLRKNMIDFNHNEYNDKVNDYELKINNLYNELSEKKNIFTDIIEKLKKLNMNDLIIEYDKIHKIIDYCSMESPNKKFNKYKKKDFESRNMKRQYSTISRYYTSSVKGYKYYSTINKNDCSDSFFIGMKKNNDYIDKNSNFVEDNLSDFFLNDVSVFYKNVKQLVDNGLKDGVSMEYLQHEIENYIIEFGCEEFVTKISGDKDISKYSDTISALNNYKSRMENRLLSFIDSYYKNNYKKLICEIKKENKNVNIQFLIFLIESDVLRKKLESKDKLSLAADEFLGSRNIKKKEIWVNKVFDKRDNVKSIISNIISFVAKIMFAHYSEDDNMEEVWGTVSQSTLVNKLGAEIVKLAPKNISDVFWNSITNLNDENKNCIKHYFENIFSLYLQSEEFKAQVGATILDMLMHDDVKLLVIDKITTEKKKKNIYITISNEFIEFFQKKVFVPRKLPMLFTPKKWIDNKNNEGGYLNSDYKTYVNSYLIHKNFKNKVKSDISNIQLDTVNFLNKQEFKINKDMLNLFLSEYYSKSNILYDGLNLIHQDTNNLKTIDDLNYKKIIISHNSKVHLYQQILSIAIIFQNTKFYIPTFLDFRGRIYTSVDYLNYQATDLSRSLIEFYNGCKLDNNNIIYVLQYLANLGGKSKLTLRNKVKWSIEIINKLNITKDDLNYKNLNIDQITFKDEFLNNFNIQFLINNHVVKDVLLKINDKFQFISTLYNMINCIINKDNLFHNPICFDATCNGFQHLSAIFRDVDIAYSTNVLKPEIYHKYIKNDNYDDNNKSNDDDMVGAKDVYNLVAVNLVKSIQNLENKELKDKYSNIEFDRTWLKKPVMTIPYNVGLDKMNKQLINDGFFEERYDCSSKNRKTKFYIVNKKYCKDGKMIQLSLQEMGILSGILYNSVYHTFPNLRKYVEYMKKIGIIFSNLNIPIEWETPVGMNVKMKYINFESKPVKSFFSKIRLGSVSLPISGEKMDLISNKTAFMPNFIHSMDSTNIQILIKKYLDKNIDEMNLFTIHDCFATTPNFMKILNRDVRVAFIMIYFEKDYIKSVHENFLKQIYKATKKFYIKINNKTEQVEIKDINKLNLYEEYIIKLNKKEYIIPSLPYKLDYWEKVKTVFEEGIKNSEYFIN